jgi:hypothetical protein
VPFGWSTAAGTRDACEGDITRGGGALSERPRPSSAG